MANTVVQPPVANIDAITDPVYQYSSDNGFFTASFAPNIGTDDAVKFTTNGYSFGWRPENVIYVDSVGNMDVVFGVNAQATAQVYKNRVSYVGTSQITTDEFECQGNQLKHTIRMVAPPRIPAGFVGTPVQMASGGVITYDSRLSVYANGQVQTTDFEVTGDIGFKDADGNLIYKLPMITVEDANEQSTTGTYKVTFNADGTISFYGMVPWDFLQTAAYPVVIDPTVVVSSAYDISGNGGRKIVRLSNGNIYICASGGGTSTQQYLYRSTDNGQTWSQFYNTGSYQTNGMALATDGTKIYLIFTNTRPDIYFYVFADGNATPTLSKTGLDSSGTSFGGISLAIDGTGALHATWSSKNSTYPNSFNIRYSKSTDGGTTWATPTQVTVVNTSGADCQNPCIVVRSNNLPTILNQYYNGTQYIINALTYNGTSWTSTNVYNGVSYAQFNPCAAVDSNDVIHVAWHGEDGTYTSTNQIKYSKSTDGGTTWSAMTNLTTITTSAQHQQYPSITINPTNNDLYVLWAGLDTVNSVYNIHEIVYSNNAWGSVIKVTNNTTASDNNPQTLWSKFNMNSSDAIRYIWQDNQVASVKYDSITLNTPPNAPTLTTHGNFDATVAQTLLWTFSDPDSGNTQSAYQLQIYDTANTSAPVVDTGKVGSTSSSYSLAANTLSNGKSYQWRVQTWDQSGAQGPYSGYSTFSTSAAPVASVTAPTSGGTVTSDSYTFTGSYSQPNGVVEQSFQFKLWNSTGTTLVQDSGTITGTSNAKTFSSLANNTSYQVEFIVTSQDGVSATSGKQSFSVAYTPPATPTVTTTNMYSDASVLISADNPAPTGSQPPVSSNTLYRRKVGDTSWRNLGAVFTGIDPTFTRSSVAYDPTTLAQVASGVPRFQTAKYGQGVFIEEGTTNLVSNPDFEVVTTTAQVFADALTSYTGSTVPVPWTLQSGSFTFGASGATCGVNNSMMVAGNAQWKSVLGSDGTTKLALTVQADFTQPTTVTGARVFLFQDGNNFYYAWISATQFGITKSLAGTQSYVGTPVSFTPTASTKYTITLQLDNTGTLKATVTPSGGATTTFNASDTSLAGGFREGVGGDTGVIISNAKVTAPFANSWTIGGDSRVAWALSQSAIAGKYSVSAVGVGSNIVGVVQQNLTLSNTTTYTLSGYAGTQNEGASYGAYIYLYKGATSATATAIKGTTSTERYNVTATTDGTGCNVQLVQQDSGTVTFDNIQLEQKAYATSYTSGTRNAETLTLPASVLNLDVGTIRFIYTPSLSSTQLKSVQAILAHFIRANSGGGTVSDGAGWFGYNSSGDWGIQDIVGLGYADTFNAGDRREFVISWDTSQVYMYMNGAKVATGTKPSNWSLISTGLVYIGSYYNAILQANGTIDDFAIWNRALSDSEVSSIYNSVTPLTWTDDKTVLLHFDSTLQATRHARDYTCPLGTYEYGVTGVSSAGATSDYGTSQVTASFTGEWVVDESNSANNVVFLYNQRESDATVNQSYNAVQTFAKYPRIRKGQARYRTGNLTALKLSQDGDVISQVDAIDAMCNSDNTYLLKSVNGRIYRVSLSNFKYTGKYGNSIADVSVQWTEVGDV